jgi:Bardet-Biedl syndrome 4 protein
MASTTVREKRNWLIHSHLVRHEHDEALRLIDEALSACGGLCEYALTAKAAIRRLRGAVGESLQLSQAALCLSPKSLPSLKAVGRSLFLAGRHRAALDVYREAERAAPEDWETAHSLGVCHARLGELPAAVASFTAANSIARHPATFLALARAQAAAGDLPAAVDTLGEALEYTPENAELLTALGLLHHRGGDDLRAFECLGNSLAHAPREPRAVLAAAALIQQSADFDVALVKYRVAAVHAPGCAQLWNNIGMCFAGKGKHVAAVACLKRAQLLDPFQAAVCFNLGIVHLRAGCAASAFLYLNAAASMNPRHAETLMYLGATLARLEDGAAARAAYERALAAPGSPPALQARLHLNYGITLWRLGDASAAKAQLARLECLSEVRVWRARARRWPSSTHSRTLVPYTHTPHTHTRSPRRAHTRAMRTWLACVRASRRHCSRRAGAPRRGTPGRRRCRAVGWAGEGACGGGARLT